jgi:hypothetical protein
MTQPPDRPVTYQAQDVDAATVAPVYIGAPEACPCGAGGIDANGLCPAGHDDLERAGLAGATWVEVLYDSRFPDDVTADPQGRLTGYPRRGVR